ncbi:acyltransferase [Paenibacillus physcomitrellae]|uniref:Acyltransferase 3 domain-containing protein n=1 Tax=Paenibacillus physcomitrellae TaxID=1619311 RepID=A0ABQ1FVQ1_9BACL|nr:acyltransferase [Paenibacillus physcomitrellae]GGA31045.1 hypothetical protein GCM10010917_15150 [Paenibacillus physcomitrellae]
MNVTQPGAKHKTKPRIESLDIYRAIAILAVVMIHVTSNPVVRMQQVPGSGLTIFYEFWNKLSQFAVPAFIFLSGLVLFYNYADPERQRSGWVLGFYKKRLLYIFVPYAVWSFIYFLMKQGRQWNHPLADWKTFLIHLLTGNNYEHLYYFLILIQFYVLFPPLLAVLRYQAAVRWLIPFAVVFQTGFYFLNNKVLHWTSGDLFASYFLLFALGASFGLKYERAMELLRKWAWLVLPLFVLIGLCFVFAGRIYYDWVPQLLPYKAVLNFAIYYLFTAVASFSLLLIARALFLRWQNGWPVRLLSSFGAASFAIFLVHPLLLYYWRLAVVGRHGEYYHYLTWLGGAVVFLVSWAFYLLLRRWRWSQYVIGR